MSGALIAAVTLALLFALFGVLGGKRTGCGGGRCGTGGCAGCPLGDAHEGKETDRDESGSVGHGQ